MKREPVRGDRRSLGRTKSCVCCAPWRIRTSDLQIRTILLLHIGIQAMSAQGAVKIKLRAGAYPHKKGRGYEEGQQFLAQAKRKIKRLRRQVKGY